MVLEGPRGAARTVKPTKGDSMGSGRNAATAWESLTIANDFVFCKAMLDEELCRDVLEAVLEIPIDRVEHVERQHVMDAGPGSKSVRLDVYVRDGKGTIFDVEMQVANDPGLARRSRYYHAQMATEQLERGASYRDLPDAYSIFFCLFDPFGLGRRVYSFKSKCEEVEGLALEDGAMTVFLAATSPSDDSQPEALNSLLDYIAGDGVSGDLPVRVDERVREVIGSSEWRREYMLLEWRDQDNVEKGRKEGIAIGLERGKKATEGFGQLISALLAQGRTDDAMRAASDAAERERLAAELGIEMPAMK
jgi:predicted transposase/invertase (TIGR01784 family)